jgi:hypothetical protein
MSKQKTIKRCSYICVLICGLLSLMLALISCGKENVPVQIKLKPVITAIGAKRSGTNVTFTAIVSDAGPQSALRYRWRFDGGLVFINNTTNPAVLQGYDETKSGNLTLTVTNGSGGATTVTYYIAPGLLPDNVIISVSQMAEAIRENNFTPDTDTTTLAIRRL